MSHVFDFDGTGDACMDGGAEDFACTGKLILFASLVAQVGVLDCPIVEGNGCCSYIP